MNALEVNHERKVLKVTMAGLFQMLVQSGHLGEATRYNMGENDFCPFHNKKGHIIDECIEFHQKVTRMLTLGELRIERREGNGEVAGIEKCRVQSTTSGLSRLVLYKPSYEKETNYRVTPGSYVSTPNIEAPFFPNRDRWFDPKWPMLHT